jgi:N12 class adenine-specific DNA methylase
LTPEPRDKGENVFRQAAQQWARSEFGRPLSKPEEELLVDYQKQKHKGFVFENETDKPLEPYKGKYDLHTDDVKDWTQLLAQNQDKFAKERTDNLREFLAAGGQLTDDARKEFRDLGFTDQEMDKLSGLDPETGTYAPTDFTQAVASRRKEFTDMVDLYRQAPDEDTKMNAVTYARRAMGWLSPDKAEEEVADYYKLKDEKRQELGGREISSAFRTMGDDQTADNVQKAADANLQNYLVRTIGKYGTAANHYAVQKQEQVAETARKDRVAQMSWPEYLSGAVGGWTIGIPKTAVSVAIASSLRGIGLSAKAIDDAIYGKDANPRKKVSDYASYRLGNSIDGFLDNALPLNKDLQNDFFAGKLPQGLGSTIGMAVGGASKFPRVAIAVMSSLQMGGDAYKEAIDNGATEEQAQMYGMLSAPLGVTEIVGIGDAIVRLNKGVGGSVWKKMYREAINEGLKESAEEITQEGSQDIAQNIIANLTYDPDRKWDKDVYENMLVAGISAPLASVGTTILNTARNRYAINQAIKQEQANGVIIKSYEDGELYVFDQKVPVTRELEPLVERYNFTRNGVQQIQAEIEATQAAGKHAKTPEQTAPFLKRIWNLKAELNDLTRRQVVISRDIAERSGVGLPEGTVGDSLIPQPDQAAGLKPNPEEIRQAQEVSTEPPTVDTSAANVDAANTSGPTTQNEQQTPPAIPQQAASVDEAQNVPTPEIQPPSAPVTGTPDQGTPSVQSQAEAPKIKKTGTTGRTTGEGRPIHEFTIEHPDGTKETMTGTSRENVSNKIKERPPIKLQGLPLEDKGTATGTKLPSEYNFPGMQAIIDDAAAGKITKEEAIQRINEPRHIAQSAKDKVIAYLNNIPESQAEKPTENTEQATAEEPVTQPEHPLDQIKKVLDEAGQIKGNTFNVDKTKTPEELRAISQRARDLWEKHYGPDAERNFEERDPSKIAMALNALPRRIDAYEDETKHPSTPEQGSTAEGETETPGGLKPKQFADAFNNKADELGSKLRIGVEKGKTKFYRWNGSTSGDGTETWVPVDAAKFDEALDKYPGLREHLESLQSTKDATGATATGEESEKPTESKPAETTDEADDLFEQAFAQKYGKPEKTEAPEAKELETTTTGPSEDHNGDTEEIRREGNDLVHQVTLKSGGDPIVNTIAGDMKLPRTMRYVDLDDASQKGIRKAIGASDIEADALIFAVDDKNKVAFAYNPTVLPSDGQFTGRFPTAKGSEIEHYQKFDDMLSKYNDLAKALASAEKKEKPDEQKTTKPSTKKAPTQAQNDALTNLAAAFGFEVPEAPKTEGPQLEDFGQKIGGARKDMWAHRGLTFADVAAMIPREREKLVRKDQVWPKPDYQEIYERFLEAGFTQEDASTDSYLIKMIYDSIDQPPIKLWTKYGRTITDEQWQEYIAFVAKVRDAMSTALENATDKTWTEAFRTALKDQHGMTDTTFASGRDRYALVNPASERDARKAKSLNFPSKKELWMREYRVVDGNSFTMEKDRWGDKWLIKAPNMWRSTLDFDTEEEATRTLNAFKGGYSLLNSSGKLLQSFATEQDAVESARKRYAETHKRPAGEPTRPMLQGIKRGGVDYLKGKPAKPEQFVETFGFKGVEFGNWLSKEDRQQSLNHAYNALMDLATVLHVSPQALSLGGKLSLAFGSRGRKGALAHYEPSRIAINLTKMSGAGSLAHEWAHAMDDYFGSQAANVPYAEGPHQGYASQMTSRGGIRFEMRQAWADVVSRIIEKTATNEESVAEAKADLDRTKRNTLIWMKDVFGKIRDTEQFKTALSTLEKDLDSDMRGTDAINKFVAELAPLYQPRKSQIKTLDDRRYWHDRQERQMQRAVSGELVKKKATDYITHAKNLDKMFKSKPYWSTVLEMFARAFESYVQDRTDSKSQYLVHGTTTPVQDYTGKGGKTLPATPYPQAAEREAINKAFDNFFDVVEEETGDDGNVSLKSAVPSGNSDAEERYQAIIKPALADAFAKYAFENDTPIEAMMNLLNALETRGFTPEQIRQMKPDISRFARENFLQKPKEESIDKGDDERTDIDQNSENGDGGSESDDVPGTPGDELTGSGDQRPSDSGDGDVSSDDQRVDGESGNDEKAGPGTNTGGVSTGTRGPRRGGKSGNGVSAESEPTGNYIAPEGSLTRQGSWKDAANNNLDAIELAKQIESEGRRATPEEQAKLAKFVGWGASDLANNVFRDPDGYSIKPEWKDVARRLREVMTPEERATAENSTQYAHYTSEKVIRGIWSAVQQFGFEGGSVLEPGMGIGLFPIAAPQSVIEKSAYTGIEKDAMTARIAKLLLPEQAVLETDFIKQTLPENHFDVAIGNPPFAPTKILADPKYKKNRFLLHDYFFAKSLDAVRPGGLLVFVTSKGTMDKKSDAARSYMAEKADLLGAIRLPQTAFKDNAGTDVVTDVLFFRKRMEGEEPSSEKWLGHGEVTAPNKYGEEHTGAINEYYLNHPEMVLGEHSFAGTMRHGDNEYTVKPVDGDIEEQFQNAVKNLPTGVFAQQAKSQNIVADTAARDWDPKAKKEGSLYIHDDGRLMRLDGGSGVEVTLSDKDRKWLTEYVGLRDALKQAQFDQLHAEDGTGGDWQKSLAALNTVYDAFVKKHGNILEYTDREKTKVDDDGNETVTVTRTFKNSKLLFGNDIESPLVWTLEKITDDGDIVKSKWLQERTIKPPEPPKIENIKDALMVSLDQTGGLNIGHIVQLMEPIEPTTEAKVIETLGDLIYEAPGGGWVMADEYLSGNVKDKLEAAEAAAADPKYRRNVEALRKVQPLPLPPEKITIQIGATWVPVEHVNEFAKEVLGMTGIFDRASYTTRPIVEFDPVTNTWTVPAAHGSGSQSQSKRDAAAEWGTNDRSPEEILEAALNSQTVTITKEDSGPPRRRYVDKDAMAQVQAKIERMNDAFGPWLFEDPDRQKELVDYYNRKLNVIAKREFNGDHLTTPGLSFRYELYPHQKRAVWRIIQTGSTYLAHAVGAGKTLEMIVSAMEQKRLGKISKPMFAVPRHMLQQFASDFLSAYPLANIMVADEENFHTDNRRRFIAQAALNDLDAIIIPHSSFGLLRTSEETSRIVLDDLLAEMRQAMDELTTGTDKKGKPKGATMQDTATIKRIQQRIESIEQKFYGRMNSARDNVLDFEELGVDFLYVDEAHEFRKLDFVTNQSNLKGVDPNGSMRALDLLVKARWLDSKRPGRSLVLASGTPLTNTMAELYSIQRLLGYGKLTRDGLDHFDAWSRQFGKVEEHIEPNAAGAYQPVKRFSKFINTGILMQGVQQFMDILTLRQMIEEGIVKVPKIMGGKPEIVVGDPPAALTEYKNGELSRRIEASKNWKPSPPDEMFNPDPMINIITDAQLAGFDMRFIYPELPSDPASKLNQMIDGMLDAYHKYNDIEYFNQDTGEAYPIKGAAHIVFSYVGIGKQVAINRGFDARSWIRKRLIEGGVPNSEIAFIGDYEKTSQKEALFREVREGKKKFLIGSPKNMGTGVNAQLRLKTMHFGSAPWVPADVEQPDGRIIRQGNQNDEVELKRYATRATYDETQWAMLSRKSRNIEDVMMGTYDGDVEDLSESSQYAMASALVSGDPRAIRVAQLRGEVEKYNRLEHGYYSTRNHLQYILRDLNSEWGGIPSVEKQIKEISDAIDVSPTEPITKETFSITIGKDTFDKTVDKNNADIGTVLKEAWKDQIAKNKKKAIEGKEVPFDVGTVLGKYPITGGVWEGAENNIFSNLYVTIGPKRIRLTDSPFGTNERLIDQDISESGLITRIYNAFNSLKEQKAAAERVLADKQKEKTRTEEALERPFEHKDALVAAREELNRLQQEMVSDGEELPAVSLTATDIKDLQNAYQPNLVPGSREDVEHEPVEELDSNEVGALREAYDLSKAVYGNLKSALGDENVPDDERMTVEDMRDQPHRPLEDIVNEAQIEQVRPGVLKMNPTSHELLRRTNEQVRIEAAAAQGKKLKESDYEDLFGGEFMEPKPLRDTVAMLRQKAEEARSLGYDDQFVKTFTDHADALEQASKDAQGTAVAYILSRDLPHELFHQADFLGAVDKSLLNRHTDESKKKLDVHAVRQILWDKHYSKINQYKRHTKQSTLNAELRAEIPPFLLNSTQADLDAMGITPEMQADYILTWFEGYVAKNGLNSLDNFNKDELNVQEYIAQAKEAAEATQGTQTPGQQNAASGSVNETGSSGHVDESSGQTGTDAPGDRGGSYVPGEGIRLTAETYHGRRIEKRDIEKEMGLDDDKRLRSLPLTLRRAGLDALDDTYEVFHDTVATEMAEDLLNSHGIDGSIDLLRNIPAKGLDAQHGILSFMIIKTLQNHARSIRETDPETARKHFELSLEVAREHAVTATQVGRFTRTPSIIGPSVESLIYAIQGIIEARGEGKWYHKTMSAEAWQHIESIGRDLESALATIENLRRENKNKQAQIKRLKDEQAGKRRRRTRRGTQQRQKLADQVEEDKKLMSEVDEGRQRLLAKWRDQAATSQKSVLADTQQTLKSTIPADQDSLDDDDLKDFANVGAMMLIKGLASPDDYMPRHFKAEMMAEFGDGIEPYFDQIYKAAWDRHVQILNDIRYKNTKEKVEAKYNEGEPLEDWQIEEILGDEKKTARRRRFIEKYHEYKSGGKPANRNLNAYKDIIAELSTPQTSDGGLIAAVAFAEKVGTAEIHKRLVEAGVTEAADQRKALREGNDLWEQARKEFAKRDEEVANEILQKEGELKKIDELQWEARQKLKNSQAVVADELRRIKNGEGWYALSKLTNTLNASRTLMASFDFSAVLRQGGFFTFAKPEMQGKALVKMFKSISEKGFGRTIQELEAQPNFTLTQRMGIDYAMAGKTDEGSLGGEELFKGDKTIESIPLVGPLVAAGVVKWSERTYTAFLDTQRYVMASAFAQELMALGLNFRDNPEEFRKIGDFINIATGRGVMPSNKFAKLLMDLPLFAPRYTLSRLQLLNMTLNPVAYANMPPAARKIVAGQAIRFYGTTMGILGLAATIGAYIGASVNWDPDDDDFMKIKMGSSKFDILAGTLQPTKVMLKIIYSAIRTKGGFDNRLPGEFGYDVLNALGRYARGKLSPSWSLATDFALGADYVGDQFTWGKALLSRVMPLTFNDLYEAYKLDGVVGTAAVIPGVFGVGLTTYKDRPERPETEAEKLAAKAVAYRLSSQPQTAEEKAKRQIVQDLTARSRKGEDVGAELDQQVKDGNITAAQKKNILEAKTKSYLVDKAEGLTLDEFERVVQAAKPNERAELMPLLNKKMKDADVSKNLKPEQRIRLEKLGGHVLGDFPMPDAVKQEFDRFNLPTPDVGENLTLKKGAGRTKLTPDQYDKYRHEALERIYGKIDEIIKDPEYKKASPDDQQAMIERAIRRQRSREQKETKREMRDAVSP